MSEALSKAVAEQVRRLCDERQWKGRQLAEATGLNQRSVERKLKGDSPFDVDDLAAIAPVFGVTTADLIGWAEKT